VIKKYYFDANALFKYYRDEKGSLNVRRLVSSAKPIYISPVTWLECQSILKKQQRQGKLKPRAVRQVWHRLRDDVSQSSATSRPFCELPMSGRCFRQAGSILLEYAGQFQFSANDALHLAITYLLPDQTIFVTSDQSLKNVCNNIGLSCYDPEIE
jgi:predicted nucleic acid-binding protein